jgi:hypothetical protein
MQLGFSFTDELVSFLLLFIYLISKLNSHFKIGRSFFLVVVIFIFYFGYSLLIGLQPIKAIVWDGVVLLKPFIGYFVIYELRLRLSDNNKKVFRVLCYSGVLLCVFIGFLGEDAMNKFFGHPSRLATCTTICALLYFAVTPMRRKTLVVFLFMLAVSLLSQRSKALGFFGFASFATLLIVRFPSISKYRMTFLFICLLGAIISVVLAWDKIEFYFFTGTQTANTFARPAMYLTSFDIARDYFPLGSGLGSFSSYASTVYYSSVYDAYSLSAIEGLQEDSTTFACDAFTSQVIGQFGVTGVFLFAFAIQRVLGMAFRGYSQGAPREYFMLTILIIAFFLIESFVDNTFVQNRGLFMMMLLGYIAGSTDTFVQKRKERIAEETRKIETL